ncbi:MULTISPECIES: hypothetical protein [Methylocaldum]|jgi:hypothetical protein|uniref:hypothetical protein n=1 Tax=unclassified Methylocaldum TaxID=2622260 RepID=UPI00105BE045|nr:hypothetical protein [Methylocaldum sp. RMAD-M]MBP1149810.1 hypothetical protein [Methylocaldum sp. RMAD-M]
MNPRIATLIENIQALEEELEAELAKHREEFRIKLRNGRIDYAHELLREHRRLKASLTKYIVRANPLTLLTAPIIYSLIVPFVLLDLAVTLYQAVCFPIYGIPKVKRGDYLVFDRGRLAYLNLIEKLNCAYCSYGNGLLAYVREIAARTELHWCPIKHARRIKSPHSSYGRFLDYGDAETYRREIEKTRRNFGNEKSDQP